VIADWICITALWFGTFFVFVASLGLVRMPDLYTRAHAAGKAGTFGKMGILVAVCAAFGAESSVTIKSLLVVLFLFVTAPVGLHLLLRAAHRRRETGFYLGTDRDDFETHKSR
jgi:multicomponent Na+:H+ antiporter subunit G